MKLLKQLYPLRLAPVSTDTDKAVDILMNELPFKVHEFPQGLQHNGWTVPRSWNVTKAEIRKDGKLIYDGNLHPLGVMGYSKPFCGSIAWWALKNHLTYRKDLPDAIGYHCDYYYKPWLADWGFSMPYNLYKTLEAGIYDIDIQIRYGDETMKVLDFTIPGESDKTIIFNAHNCHAGQANDDISGVVIGVEIMKRLRLSDNYYTYKLIIAPEHLGTVFYLSEPHKWYNKGYIGGFFLEMLGNINTIAFQESFHGDTLIDKAAKYVLRQYDYYHTVSKFRKVVGNDETVWEAPGIEIPFASMTRWPYEAYHSSLDNESIISKDTLESTFFMMMMIIDVIDTDCRMVRCYDGLLCLSNPKYDLYISSGRDPSGPIDQSDHTIKWNYLMDCLPRYFDTPMTILDIAIKHDIKYSELRDYLKKYEEKKLIKFV